MREVTVWCWLTRRFESPGAPTMATQISLAESYFLALFDTCYGNFNQRIHTNSLNFLQIQTLTARLHFPFPLFLTSDQTIAAEWIRNVDPLLGPVATVDFALHGHMLPPKLSIIPPGPATHFLHHESIV
jgi:hypothetical protein